MNRTKDVGSEAALRDTLKDLVLLHRHLRQQAYKASQSFFTGVNNRHAYTVRRAYKQLAEVLGLKEELVARPQSGREAMEDIQNLTYPENTEVIRNGEHKR